MKFAFHRAGPPVDPDRVPAGDDEELLAGLAAAARRVLPGYDPDPVATERCFYDNTADEDFVLDRVGNVVVGFGTTGHGFKFSPLLGEVLADLATGSPGEAARRCPALDPARFALARPSAR